MSSHTNCMLQFPQIQPLALEQINAQPTPQIYGKAGLFPIASSPSTGVIAWIWPAADPNRWNIEESADGETGWTHFGLVLGPIRSISNGVGGNFFRVTGLDGFANPITLVSNPAKCL